VDANGVELEWEYKYEGGRKGPTEPTWSGNNKFFYFEATLKAMDSDSPYLAKKPISVIRREGIWQRKSI
jgi:hypothetical protein